jgi:hypothetical protein
MAADPTKRPLKLKTLKVGKPPKNRKHTHFNSNNIIVQREMY